jgi:hypothetical protein
VTRPIKPFDWYCTDMDQWLAYIYDRFDDEGWDITPEYETMLHGLAKLVSWAPKGSDPEARRTESTGATCFTS